MKNLHVIRLIQGCFAIAAVALFIVFYKQITFSVPLSDFAINLDAVLTAPQTIKFSGFQMNYPEAWPPVSNINPATHEKDYQFCRSGRCLNIQTYAPTPVINPAYITTIYHGTLDGYPTIETREINPTTNDVVVDEFVFTPKVQGRYRYITITGTNINDAPDYRSWFYSLIYTLIFINAG